MGQKGILEYLVGGKKATSDYTRTEKDKRIPLGGDILAVEKSIKHLQNNKKYKNNYYHCSLSFTASEWQELEKNGNLDNLIRNYVELNFPNYDIENELIWHAKAHLPVIQREQYKKRGLGQRNFKIMNQKYQDGEWIDRHPHVHIVVLLENQIYSNRVHNAGVM